ncbi:hydrophobe/amphiphile efflux-1 (HAE1) family transporter [Anopheles sinensis]|uniref:Hydrophobe/amphiphile efflux-1 (HAE1) family transporter n=1 Tax=Anopheles sinensis TaxID=74873 RepID=A0A084W848_ANOSI|nr:hydrophobe/amphiphile efflux-1 (HAE1) family transporter [Anopheles sinensis]
MLTAGLGEEGGGSEAGVQKHSMCHHQSRTRNFQQRLRLYPGKQQREGGELKKGDTLCEGVCEEENAKDKIVIR